MKKDRVQQRTNRHRYLTRLSCQARRHVSIPRQIGMASLINGKRSSANKWIWRAGAESMPTVHRTTNRTPGTFTIQRPRGFIRKAPMTCERLSTQPRIKIKRRYHVKRHPLAEEVGA